MGHGNPAKEESRGKRGLYTLLLAHIPLSPLREFLLHKDVLCSKG